MLELDCPDITDSSFDISIMDAIPALDVACSILAAVEFSTKLISTSNQSQGELSLDDKDDSFVLKELEALILALSVADDSAERFSATTSQPSSDALALHQLASSCVKDSEKLLGDIGYILGDSPGRKRSHFWTDTKTRAISMLGGRLHEEKIELLSRAVTLHVSSIIRCARRFYFNILADTDIWY